MSVTHNMAEAFTATLQQLSGRRAQVRTKDGRTHTGICLYARWCGYRNADADQFFIVHQVFTGELTTVWARDISGIDTHEEQA